MTQHIIQTNKLYILSGPSCSGKSYLTNQLIEQGLPSEAIVSADTIRKNTLGSVIGIDNYGQYETLIGWDTSANELYQLVIATLNIRLKQKLTTFIDMTNLVDSDRKKFINLAKEHGMESEVIIFDTPIEVLKERLKKRQLRFSVDSLEKQLKSFQKTSAYPFITIKNNDEFILLPNKINNINLDVIGDTHGLLNHVIDLLNKNGWSYENNQFTNKNGRTLLFLGDIVDRGPDSISLLKAIKNTVDNKQAILILGNHEAKLISSYETYKKDNIIRGKSLSSSQTFIDFLKLPTQEQEELYSFLKNTPTYYTAFINKDTLEIAKDEDINNDNIKKFAFVHANNRYFSPLNITYSHALYGEQLRGNDTDFLYEQSFGKNINQYVYIRGHIPNISKQNNIYSLDEEQAFKGNLVLLKFDNLIKDIAKNNWQSTHNIFEDNIMKEKSNFDFNEESENKINLFKGLNKLFEDGLITDGWRKDENGVKQAHADGFKIYKYSKSVHFKRLWKTDPLLEKTRGLGVDIAGNIIVHPFDKIYNYGEYDAGLNVDNNTNVQVIEKLNGFLGNISPHPIRNELLLSTTGSFNSPFIQYISDFIDEKRKSILLDFFKNNKMTLMFEVIHPEDKHIIEYKDNEFGLYLIGARNLDINSNLLSELELDELGKKLSFKRPNWYIAPFKEVLDNIQKSELEGYMIRDTDTNETIMKIKTNYYLVTKFVGRMGSKMISHMYKNTNHFKENSIDEEFYPIVDEIVNNVNQDTFSNMLQEDRVTFVRNIVNKVRNDFSHSKSTEDIKNSLRFTKK